MAQGLQVFDGAGATILDTSNTVFRTLGHISVTSSGSMSIELPPRSRFFSYMMPTYAGSYPESRYPPSAIVKHQDGVMSWSLYLGAGVVMGGYRLNIIYGCY